MQHMKQGIRQIVGKRIMGVVVSKTGSRGRMHVFLAFSDNTYFELWATSEVPGEIAGCGGLDKGGIEEIKRYVSDQQIILESSE